MSEDNSGTPVPPESDADRQAREQLFASLYAELHRLADRELRRHPGVSVSPTTLVHEAYVNLADRDGARFEDRGKSRTAPDSFASPASWLARKRRPVLGAAA